MRVGVLFPSRFEDPGEFLADARAIEAAGADSVWLEAGGLDPMLALAAIAAVTVELRLGLIVFTSRSLLEGERGKRFEMLQQLSRQRALIGVAEGNLVTAHSSLPLAGGGHSGIERWRRITPPADRQAWAAALEQAEHEADGVLVPMNPRLLDTLRHPDEAIDRSDLQLAQG